MLDIILGNVWCLAATITDAFSGTRKTKKGMLIAQALSQVFYIISALALNAYSAAAQNAVSFFRNIYGIYDEKHNKFMDWLFIILPVVLGLYFNNQGLLGLIPVIANLEYALALFVFAKNPTTLKIAFIICTAMFIFFNFCILNFVGGISCFVVVISTSISVYQELKSK